MDILHHVRAGEAQEVVIAFQLAGQVGQKRAPEVGFCQAIALYHGAHGSVQDEDAGFD